MEYKTVNAHSAEEVDEMVRESIKNGWIPKGEMEHAICMDQKKIAITFTQTMTRQGLHYPGRSLRKHPHFDVD